MQKGENSVSPSSLAALMISEPDTILKNQKRSHQNFRVISEDSVIFNAGELKSESNHW